MGSNEADNLTQQMENIVRESDALIAAMQRARAIRLLLFVALVAFVLVTVLKFYQLAEPYRGEANQKILLAKVQDRWNRNSDRYVKEVEKLVEKCTEPLTTAFYDQAKKDLPSYFKKVEGERDTLLVNLERELAEKLTIQHQDSEGKYKRMLQAEFPTLQDERVHAKMVDNVQKAVNNLVKRYYVQELHDELQAFYNTWDQFPVAEKPAKGAEPLEDELVAALLLILQHRLAHTEAPVASSR